MEIKLMQKVIKKKDSDFYRLKRQLRYGVEHAVHEVK